MNYSIAKEFSTMLPGRHIEGKTHPDTKDGVHLFKNVFEKLYNDLKDGEKIIIDLDGTMGYPISFLDDAFGSFARKYGIDKTLNTFEFISNDEPELVEKIQQIIRDSAE